MPLLLAIILPVGIGAAAYGAYRYTKSPASSSSSTPLQPIQSQANAGTPQPSSNAVAGYAAAAAGGLAAVSSLVDSFSDLGS
jgi:hypothetical protein